MLMLHEIEIVTVHWMSPSRFRHNYWKKDLRAWLFEFHIGVRRNSNPDGLLVKSKGWRNPYIYGTVLGFQFGAALLFMNETDRQFTDRYLAAEKAKEAKP